METASAVLFVLAFVLPPAVVVASVIALVLGSWRRDVASVKVHAREAVAR